MVEVAEQAFGPGFEEGGSGVLEMTFGSTAMSGILFAADARPLPRWQPDLPLESMPSTKFVSTEVTGCVSERGWTFNVRSSEEAEALAGAVCALIGIRGIAELSSQKEILKRQTRKANLTSCPKCAHYPTPSNCARNRTHIFLPLGSF